MIDLYERHPKYVGWIYRNSTKVVTIADVWTEYLKNRGFDNVLTLGNPIDYPEEIHR